MRLLFYNWADYLDPQGRGGGVTGYLRSLLAELPTHPGVECVFLSSGIAQEVTRRRPWWREIPFNAAAGPVRRFEIVNSGCLSPAHHSFGHPTQLSEPATEAAFAEFLDTHGPFDAIHFQNLEGIPAACLALRQRVPQTRFLLSLHNYYPFCPQVNLWHREQTHCDGYEDGARCVRCLPFKADPRAVRLAYAVDFTLRRNGVGPGTALYDRAAGPAMRAGFKAFRNLASIRRGAPPKVRPQVAESDAAAFRDRRARMVELINRNCDTVLCVSERTAEIAAAHGIAPRILRTGYIGSDHADRFARTRPATTLARPDGTTHMAYLGYMRRDKGLHFLLAALEGLDHGLAARLHLTVAAAGRDPQALAAMDRLRPRLAALTWHDGFARDALDSLLEGVDFGILPGLWEDPLPQVAIEMHARHIPLLVSDRGGARELANFPQMVFTAGDATALHARLSGILDGAVDLRAYWSAATAPVTLENHIEALLALYRAAPSP